MINVNEITTTLRSMPDRLLQQYAMMNKANPYVLSLAVAESNQRKQLRTAAQARAMAPQPKVADAAIAEMAPVDVMGNVTGVLPEDQGIARIPARNIERMADGGIAGYGDDANEGMAAGGSMFDFAQRSEPVLRMASGGVPGYAAGVFNKERFKEFLKAKNIDEKTFSTLDFSEKEKILKDFGDMTSGPQKAAAPAASTAPTTSVKAAATPEDPRTLRKISEKVGSGTAKLLKKAGPAGVGLEAISSMGDYKIQAPDNIDTSAAGTVKDLMAGEFGRVGTGLKRGLGELVLDTGSFGANMLDYVVPGKAPVSSAYERWVKENMEGVQGPSDRAKLVQTKPQAAAAAPAAAPAAPPEVAPEAAPDAGIKTLVQSDTGLGNFKPTKAPTIEDAKALSDKFFNSGERINDIKRQVLQEQVDADTAKENSIAALEAFNKKQGPAYANYEALLKKEELQDATDKEKAGLMSLMKGFLAMAAGESPNAATNIAKGAMVGMGDYGDALKEFKKAARERTKEMSNIEQARRAEERGNFDKAQTFEERAQANRQASARFGIAAINDITNAGAKASTDIYNTLSSNASRENIAAMGERGANIRAQTPDKILFDQLRSKYGGDAVKATEEIQKLKSEKFNVYDAYTKYLMAFANKEGVSPPMEFDQFAAKFIPTVTPNKNTTVRTQPGG